MGSVTRMVTKNGPQHQADWEYIASFHPEIAKALLDEIEQAAGTKSACRADDAEGGDQVGDWQ